MIGADTNMLARFLINDVKKQALAVNELLDDGEIFYINPVVLSELSWVLLNIYEYSKYEFIQVLDKLFMVNGFHFFDQDIVKHSIEDYISSSADFNDCLINQINQNQNITTLTFDKKASKLEGMNLLV